MQTIINDLIRRIEVLEDTLLKTKVKRFEPPELNEVYLHMTSKGCDESQYEAEKFINFYGSNGWKVGKNKMVNWKLAASGWISGKLKNNTPVNQKQAVQQSLSNITDTSW